MSAPVSIADELVGSESRAFKGDLRGTRFHEFKVSTGYSSSRAAGRLIHQHDLSTERTHHVRTLGGVAARHDSYEGIALYGADDGKTRAHVATRQLDHGLAGAKCSRSLGCLDDPERRPVLLREPGIQIIELEEYSSRESLGDSASSRSGVLPIASRIEEIAFTSLSAEKITS